MKKNRALTHSASDIRGTDVADKPNASVVTGKSRFDRATLPMAFKRALEKMKGKLTCT